MKTEANTRPDNRNIKQARLKYRQALDLFKRRLANLNKTDMLSYKKDKQATALRKEFLAIANPFLEKVQSKSGLNAFKVVMDSTNNTPETIDRNQLIGHIFLQPTKAAEFITIDFVVQRTGAEFSE